MKEVYWCQLQVNVIITSDHGMTSIKKETGTEYVKLEDYVTDSDDIYKVIDSGAVMSIAASEGRSESVNSYFCFQLTSTIHSWNLGKRSVVGSTKSCINFSLIVYQVSLKYFTCSRVFQKLVLQISILIFMACWKRNHTG